jgi:hypothetical protein
MIDKLIRQQAREAFVSE